MSFLELKNVQKSFYLGKKKFPVLKGINLSLDRGEFVSILGESGGGKTTLLNTIGGLDSQFEGDILVDGKSLKKGSNKALDNYRSHTVGFVFQSFHLISHLTVLENVLVPLEMSTLGRHQRTERAKELLTKVGLSDQMDKHPNQLSGGQKQRVAIARALANDPEIIIADEPTGALDGQNTTEVLRILDEIAQEGKLVIAVTHSQTVANYGTRIVHLANGVIDSDTSIRQKYLASNFRREKKITHLSFGDTFRLAWEHMLYTKGRNILIILGAAIGIFSVIFMLGLGSGITGYINKQMSNQVNPNAIQVTKNVASSQVNSSTDSSDITMSDTDMQKFAKIDHVKKIEKAYFAQAPKVRYEKKTIAVPYFQTWNATEKTGDIIAGSKPGKNEIILLKSDANRINKKHYKSLVGKKLTIYIPSQDKDKKPVQVQTKLTISGIIKSGSTAISYDTLKSASSNYNVSIKPNFVTLTADNTLNVKAIQDKIKGYKTTNAKGKKVPAYTITGVGAIIDSLNTYLKLAFDVLAAIAGISLVVSAIMIIVVLYISVSERTHEIGILRAIGARKKDIRNMFISESFLIGLVSGTFAVIIAYLVQFAANSATQNAFKATIVNISPGNAIFGIVVSIVISLIAALAPSHRAAKLDPRDSLTDE
ncbi:ATP-binding cassette domain-containing protein [Companilactobacillus ginsenosidimutans]|uniref:ABC transporter ATP-binding protein n=1 Tax=Companilactobacillus ginsenosidimutans TaxID=1007676 RepID=A0A0H4QHZ1_9LACO|nr:ABC transporter ATP-binding protein/permease [Companilactobacillus ginsenosidimutans]AKP68019.1 ABC transporter ATP-binding protein [Companilactobacillus ginsenosidimutans]